MVNSMIFSLVTLLVVVSTGNLASPFFFLLYFLLFGLSFVFEPVVSLVLTLTYTLFSLVSGQTFNQQTTINLASLWLITPLALFFGQAYLKLLQQKRLIRLVSKKKKKLTRQLIQDETDILLWLSLDLKKNLTTIIDQTSQIIASLINLPPRHRQSLKTIRRLCRKLLRSSELLQQRVDKLTDKNTRPS